MSKAKAKDRREQPSEIPGIVCPKCECRHFDVEYTRPRVGRIVRARRCRNCGYRVITTERIG